MAKCVLSNLCRRLSQRYKNNMANIGLEIFKNRMFGLFLMSPTGPTQMGSLSVKNSATNISPWAPGILLDQDQNKIPQSERAPRKDLG